MCHLKQFSNEWCSVACSDFTRILLKKKKKQKTTRSLRVTAAAWYLLFINGIRGSITKNVGILFSLRLYLNPSHCLFHPFQFLATFISYACQDQWEQTTIKRCLHTGMSFNQQNQLNTTQILSRKPYQREKEEGKWDLWSSGENAARLVSKYTLKN